MDFGKQVGPLPLGAWVAVVGGGLGIAIYSSQKSKSQKNELIVEDTSGAAGVGTGAAGFINATPIMVDNTPQITTNEQWAVAAINYLIASGYDPAVADTAVRKYLESTQLSLQETAMIRYALVKLGSPPQPLPNPPEVPTVPKPVEQKPPPPPPPPAPAPVRPGIRIHVVVPWPARGSSLWSIAEIYYGNGNQWRRLFDANRKGTVRPDGSPGFISNPNYLRPGDRVYVP